MANRALNFITTTPYLQKNLSLQRKCSARRCKVFASRGFDRDFHIHDSISPQFNKIQEDLIEVDYDTSNPISFHEETGGISSGSGGSGSSDNRRDRDDDSNDDLPDDMKQALALGLLSKEALQRYRAGLENPWMRLALCVPAFRSRFLADSAFAFKLLVQELVGNGTALASEIAVRGKDIVHELEYVASDLIIGTVIEAAFVWSLAPVLRIPKQNSGAIAKYLSSLPANVFQTSTTAQTFTLLQRIVSFGYVGLQYAAMGFAGGLVGTAITYGLIEARKRLEKGYSPERPLPDVISNSAAWGVFMAVSSNTRFQIVEGIEQAIAKVAAGRAPAAVNTGIVALRLANNYWGGVQFVQFFRFLGLHAVASDDSHEDGK